MGEIMGTWGKKLMKHPVKKSSSTFLLDVFWGKVVPDMVIVLGTWTMDEYGFGLGLNPKLCAG